MNPRNAASIRERILDAAQALVLERGFNATTIDAVLDTARASKGAFFHHFPNKAALGTALVDRYARADAEVLDAFMARAEARAGDPAAQLIEFLAAFEAAIDETPANQPGCLFVSFIYERVPDALATHAIIVGSIDRWRERILDKLERAVAIRPATRAVDLKSLADQIFTIFEGGFILARATNDPSRLRAQIGHLRTYLEMLLRPEEIETSPDR